MLPSEILLTIFKHLNHYYINNCLSVSQFFHRISMSNDLWYFLIKKYGSPVLYQYYFDITYNASHNYYKMCKILITHVDINCALNLNSICKIDRLVVPQIIGCDSEYIFQHLTDLIHIDLSVSLIYNNINMFCLKNMKNLKYVNI